jgi:erythromycin esterase-like protein
MDARTPARAELLAASLPLEHERAYDRLLERIGDARFVLLGEASHGTREFYLERARITQRLVEQKGFDAVCIEADWPDAYRVHRYVRGRSADATAEQALGSFTRFPRWMWRNTVMTDFVEWLRSNAPHVGVFGLDLYSLHASMDVVLRHLEKVDPEGAKRARARYACFDHFGTDTTAYAYSAGIGVAPSCEEEVTRQLVEMRARTLELTRDEGGDDEDLHFCVEMNAGLVKSAEEYYRSMLKGSVVTWNLRDRHMADTLARVIEHLDQKKKRPSRVVVWEHNSHLGDARATQMGAEGELNVGQLVRERYGRDGFLVGFTTFDGTVTAAHTWDGDPVRMTVRPALEGSHEIELHRVAGELAPAFVVLPDAERRLPDTLRRELLERAIGVVYRPQTERASHWFRARLGDQFDAVIHIDRTSAVEPLDGHTPPRAAGEDLPDTYPFAV